MTPPNSPACTSATRKSSVSGRLSITIEPSGRTMRDAPTDENSPPEPATSALTIQTRFLVASATSQALALGRYVDSRPVVRQRIVSGNKQRAGTLRHHSSRKLGEVGVVADCDTEDEST